jgi:hypothetical protein
MPMPGVGKMKTSEKKLLALFNRLETSGQETLLAFAEFLSQRNSGEDVPVAPLAKPQIIPRPETESVVAAIKRLSASYPMLEKPELLNKASAIMTKHVMQGHEVELAIDELEALFLQFYEEMVENFNKGKQ